MATDLLSIQPGELAFPFELRKQVSCSLRLVNLTSEYVAFKIKTTSPKKYCVRPNTGVIPPQSSAELEVVMQSQKEVPADMTCKDKFLVQSVIFPQGSATKDVGVDLFTKEKGKEIHETKLKVVYFMKDTPSPIPEESNPSPQPADGEFRGSRLEQAPSFNDVKENFTYANSSKSEPKGTGGQAVIRLTKPSGWTFTHLLLVALFAFFIGYYFGNAPTPPPVASSS